MTTTLYPINPVLLVDDEEHFLLSVELTLRANGINNIRSIKESREVLGVVEKEEFSVVLLDINMPHLTGLELLPQIIDRQPGLPVIIITAINDVENAVNCMKLGAFNYILKPVDETRLITTIKAGLDLMDMKNENRRLKQYLLKDKLEHPEAFEHIVTRSQSMRAIFKYIEAIAKTHLPILVTGETGVGKELIANAIHNISGRKGELVALNVAGVDDTLFSDTLFGHKKGAFTGAETERRGLIEQAEGGTLFLDEIGDLSIESQVKLLRLLQDSKYYPLGSDVAKMADIRIICATHRDIESMKEDNRFRKDLYYRLQAHHVRIPSLKERKTDIPYLINHFLEKASRELDKKRPTAPKELFTLLENYPFPGNVREMEGLIFNAVSMHRSGIMSIEGIKEKVFKEIQRHDKTIHENEQGYHGDDRIIFTESLPTMKEMEDILIEEALKRAKGNQTIASELLGLSRRALNNRLQRKK